MQLSTYAVPLIVVGIGNLLLGAIILSNNRKSVVNRTFALFTFCVASWSLGLGFFSISTNQKTALISAKFYYISAILIAYFVLQLSLVYPHINKRWNVIRRFGFIPIFLLIIPIILVRTFLTNNIVNQAWGFEVELGKPEYYIYSLFFLVYFYTGVYFLWRNYRSSEGVLRKNIFNVFASVSIASIFGVIFNLLLPLLGNYRLIWVGPLFSIVMIIVIFYSIIKNKIFDTRLVLGKITFYVIAGIPAYFTFFMLAYIYESIYGTSFNTAAYLIGIPVAIFFTMFVNFFNKYIAEYTDSHLINPGYNPLLVLEQLREQLAATLDAEKIVQETLFMIARTIRPDFQGIIIIPAEDTNRWISVNYKREKFENPEEFKSFVFVLEKTKYRPLTYEQILSTESYPEIDKLSLDRTKAQMEKYSISAVIPLNQDYKTTGLLILGQKEASAPYTNQELKFLKSISTTVSLAIGRALLYQEIQIFNQTLQQKVNTATSELRQKNEDLSAALIKLEEVRRQEKDMLDVMGHELRTPISIARNALLTLKKDIAKHSADEEKILKYTDMAIESVRREIGLVEAFLSTTKLEADRMQVEKEKISLTEVVNTSIEAHNNMAVKNKTQLIFNPPSQDILVIADKLRIQEVMDNFLNNAIKYTGVGNVEIQIYKDGANGWVDVKDSGIGISEEDLQKLGRKFFRARTLYNKSGNVVNPSGTGLGLFVSFNLIELMNGQRKIVSKVGEGSTFSFGLPLAST